MSSGRPDYWLGVLPGYSVMGANQSDILLCETLEIVGLGNDRLIDYTVAEDYRLHIMGGNVSSYNPGINEVIIYVSTTEYAVYMFDQNYNFPLAPGGELIIESGEELHVTVYNFDTVKTRFYAVIHGFLEHRIV